MILTISNCLKCHTYKLTCHSVYRFLHKDAIPPIKRYSSLLEKSILNADKQQFQAVLKIQELFNDLKHYNPLHIDEENPTATSSVPKGLYLYGGVGSGKTLLMDLFYDAVPTKHKKRVHFHAFMLYLYSEINRWNLCLDDEVDFVTPTEHIANKIMQDTWLVCFDEIQLADYASCTLLQGVFSHMISKGAVIVGTSNRAPEDLGDLSITDNFDGDTESVHDTVRSFSSIFEKNCHLHKLSSERDHRTEMKMGELRYFHPCSNENIKKFDDMFAEVIQPIGKLTSSLVEIYGRKILIPLSAGDIARFSYRDLCCQPLGPADYIKICNSFRIIFIDNIPKLNMNTKNEARRLLTFIDAAYESRVQLYCTADASYEELFLMLPRDDGNYEPEQMHMEMIGEIAYDLKIHGMDFQSLNIISGQDEIFSFKRAVSRLKEIQSTFYQSSKHRPQEFLLYIGSKEEVEKAEERRESREKRRRQKLDELSKDKAEGETDNEMGQINKDNNDRSYKETDWGDEASYITYSKEMSELTKEKSQTKEGDEPPKFGDQHFWGFGWWEKVKRNWKPRKK